MTIDVVGGVGASPLQWNGDGGREKTEKFSGDNGPVVQWCGSSLEREETARGDGHRKKRIRQVGCLRAVPSAFCFYSAHRSAYLTSHNHRLEPTSVPDRTLLSASSKNPDPQKPLHLLITALHICPPNVPNDHPRGVVYSCVVVLPCPWDSSSHDRIILIGPPKQQMTGRGGAGNYRSPSCDRAANGPEDYSDTRGREPVPSGDPDAVRTFWRSLDPSADSIASDRLHRPWRERKHSLALARARTWRHRQSRRVPRAVSQPWSRL